MSMPDALKVRENLVSSSSVGSRNTDAMNNALTVSESDKPLFLNSSEPAND
jgi:hypothetical protein